MKGLRGCELIRHHRFEDFMGNVECIRDRKEFRSFGRIKIRTCPSHGPSVLAIFAQVLALFGSHSKSQDSLM